LAARGDQLLTEGKLDEAVRLYDQSVASHPDFADGLVSAAVALIEKGQLNEAAGRLEKALEMDPRNWYARANLGLIFSKRGKQEEALAEFETAIEISPTNLVRRANIAMVMLKQGMVDQALEHFRVAAELHPKDREDFETHYILGSFLWKRGHPSEACLQFQKSLAINANNADVRRALAGALAEQGDFEGAVQQLNVTLEKEPDHVGAIRDLAWWLATCPDDEIRDAARAVELIRPACQSSAYADPNLVTTLAAAYAELGRWPEAVALANKALELVGTSDPSVSEQIRGHLRCYQQRQTLRQGIIAD
jgi:tetratricopeptide (TPR) repeat protein